MTVEPAVPEPDDKDWTWVLTRPCPECGFDAGSVELAELPAKIVDGTTRLAAAARAAGATVRPEPTVWSVAEYACHVRDVCRIFGERLALMLKEDDPLFANWDQDATAVAERYSEQDPHTVTADLEAAGIRLASAFGKVRGTDWRRPGRRSNGSRFTVDTLGRYCLHDIVHHLHDVDA